jgi:hypothetical protein
MSYEGWVGTLQEHETYGEKDTSTTDGDHDSALKSTQQSDRQTARHTEAGQAQKKQQDDEAQETADTRSTQGHERT